MFNYTFAALSYLHRVGAASNPVAKEIIKLVSSPSPHPSDCKGRSLKVDDLVCEFVKTA